ncbi:putative folate-biopterin transporter 7, partial [Cucurbita argyrosperma subsp. sororia]
MVKSNGDNPIRKVLGLGYWVQGFRCFPWMAVNFFLKDGLNVDPSTLQLLQNSANLPMVAKPLYGILSDAVYISGQHRIPYIAIGAFLQAVSWIPIAIMSPSSISVLTISIYLLLSNLGASIAEVANDAIVAEAGKQSISSKNSGKSSSGELQAFVWVASSAGGILGNLLGGVAIDRFSPQGMFLFFGILLSLQFFLTIIVHERSLNLPRSSTNPEHLKIESSVLGISKVLGQAALLLWGVIYNRHLKSVPSRKLISSIQVSMAVFMISDMLFVKGVYRDMGVPDFVYVVLFSGLSEVLLFFKILPFSVLIPQFCPPGCEGSLMAFVMSAIALAFIVSGCLGVALSSYVGVTASNFSGLPHGLIIQAICTLLPLSCSWCIPDDVKAKDKGNANAKDRRKDSKKQQ